MKCPLCEDKVICLSPYYLNGKIVEACDKCAKKHVLKPIKFPDLKYRYYDEGNIGKVKVPIWKADISAIQETLK